MARISLRRLGERADLSVPRGSPQMGARYDADAFGRFAEGMARFLGTGRFIVGQTVLVVGWIILNTIGLIKHWDPYPFILLNLAFSTQAAYAAPLILLAQNRQDDRDRANIERDREVAARTQADTQFLARELAAVRLALADMVTTQDLEDSLSRLAKLIGGQPLPDGRGPLTPSDRELPGPAREPVLTGHRQLRGSQGQPIGHRPDAVHGRDVIRLRGAQHIPGLAAQVAEVGSSRKGGHDVSLTSLWSARQADKEIVTIHCLPAEVDYVLPADPEAPSRA
jgi:uncharacterized membrane protein